jgi:hypothetical protein
MEAAAIKLNPPGKIIEQDLDLLIGTGYNVILACDFSAKQVTWGARQNMALDNLF